MTSWQQTSTADLQVRIGAAIGLGAVIGLALGIVVSVTTDVPLAPEAGLVLGALLARLSRAGADRAHARPGARRPRHGTSLVPLRPRPYLRRGQIQPLRLPDAFTALAGRMTNTLLLSSAADSPAFRRA